MSKGREGRSAVANIFAEFATGQAPITSLTDAGEKISQDILAAFDGLQKKSDNTRLKWSLELAEQAKLYAESPEAEEIFQRIKGDLIHALTRCSATPEMNMQVREQFLKSILALLEHSEKSTRSLVISDQVLILTALLQFRHAPSAALSRLAQKLILTITNSENDEELAISQVQYKGITKALVEMTPRYIKNLEASPESDGCASLLAQALLALAQCLRNIKAKANITAVLENLKIFNYASASEIPTALKLAGLEICNSILIYSLNNAPDQIPPKLIKQISKLNDQESDAVLRKRLKLARSILQARDDQRIILPESSLNEATVELLRKLFSVCITAASERNAGAITACLSEILLPLLERGSKTGDNSLSMIPAQWISPLRSCDGELDLRSAIVILLLRCCFVGVRKNHITLNPKDRRMQLEVKAQNLLPQKGARSDAYFAKLWELISQVCDRVWCLRCLLIKEENLGGFPSSSSIDYSNLALTPKFPIEFTTGSPEVFQKYFISPLLENQSRGGGGLLSLHDLKNHLPPDSKILLLALIERTDSEELRERLILHLKNTDGIDHLSQQLISGKKITIDEEISSIVLARLRESDEFDLVAQMNMLKQLEIKEPISAIEWAAKAIQSESRPPDLAAHLPECLSVLSQSITSSSRDLTVELKEALERLINPTLSPGALIGVLDDFKEDLTQIMESDALVSFLKTDLLTKSATQEHAALIENYLIKHSELYLKIEGESTIKQNLRRRLKALLSSFDLSIESEPSLPVALLIFGTDWWIEELNQCSDTTSLLRLMKIKPSSLIKDLDVQSSILSAYAYSLASEAPPSGWVGVDGVQAYDYLTRLIKGLTSDEELRSGRILLLMKAALSLIEDTSIPSRHLADRCENDREQVLKYLKERFELPSDVVEFVCDLSDESVIIRMTAYMGQLRAGYWEIWRTKLLDDIKIVFDQQDDLLHLIAQELICHYVLPTLEGRIDSSSTVKDINEFFDVSTSIWMVAKDLSTETVQILLLPICAYALEHLWKLFEEPGFHPNDVSEIVRFLNEVVKFANEVRLEEHVYKFIETYRSELIPLSGISRALLLANLKKPIRAAHGADHSDSDSDAFWLIIELIFGPIITELLANIVSTHQVDSKTIRLINSLVLPSLRTQFERKAESDDNVASPLVSEVVSYMDSMAILLQNLFTVKNQIVVDESVLKNLGDFKCSIKIKREASLLEYILKAVLMEKQNVQNTDALAVPQTIEILSAYAPSCLWHSNILQKSEKAYLTVLVERFGHKAYIARVREQVIVINRLLTSRGVLAHFDAGIAHVRVWDNPEYKEASLDIDVHVDLSPNIPLSLPKISVDTELKGFRESTKFHCYQILKTSADSQTLMGECAGSGGQNFILAVARIADQFHENFQELEDCVICYSRLHRVSKTPPTTICASCSNHYHAECLQQWFLTHNTRCPMCRRVFM